MLRNYAQVQTKVFAGRIHDVFGVSQISFSRTDDRYFQGNFRRVELLVEELEVSHLEIIDFVSFAELQLRRGKLLCKNCLRSCANFDTQLLFDDVRVETICLFGEAMEDG